MSQENGETADLLLDQQLCFALYAASRAMVQSYQPFLAPLSLTYPQYLVMLVLWEQDGLSLKQIGERLYLDSGTLTPLLKRLAAVGYVVRQRSMDDERHVVIRLTETGRTLRRKAAAMRADMTRQYGHQLSIAKGLKTTLTDLLVQMHSMKSGNAD